VSSNGRKYLIFSLSGKLCAFELSQVAEVCEPKPLWPIPAVPPYYHGAMNFHGSIVAVMDLAAFMELPAQKETEKLIVLHSNIAALAFLVERVIRIVSADQVEQRNAADEPFATALLVLPEGQAELLDAQAITEHAAGSINTPM